MASEDARLPDSRKNPPGRHLSAAGPHPSASGLGVDLRTPPITSVNWVSRATPCRSQELIVCCVFWGTKYHERYVKKLQAAVKRRLDFPHRFVCLSDRKIEGVDCIPIFAQKWKGWWQKVSLFMPGLFPNGARILYLDLDVIITGPLDQIVFVETKCPLTMVYNFGPNRHHCAHNSSVMLWVAGDPRVANIYELFTDDVMGKLHGDQCWIWRVLRENIANWPLQPNAIQSYKYDCRPVGNPRPDTSVVVFHGDPKPHQVQDSWVVEAWRGPE